MARPIADVPYTLNFANGQVVQGVLDEQGHALHSPVPDSPAHVQYQLPEFEPDQPWPAHVVLTQLSAYRELELTAGHTGKTFKAKD
ncbi:hypothetical protein D3C75_1125080 [compost metagenome]